MIVTRSLPAHTLPAAAPPSLTKSLSFIAASLPAPTTIRRDALRPSGSRMSRVDPLLPLYWLVAAARLTRLAALPRDLRVAGPSFNVSSQKITTLPRPALVNGTKPSLRASDIGKILQNRGCG